MKSILFNPQGWSEGLLSGMLLSLVVGLLGISVLYLAQRVWPSKSAATRFWVVFSILCVVLVSFVGVFLYAVLRSPYLSTSNQPLAYLMTLWSVETPVWSWQQLWIDVLIWSYFVGLILQMCLLFRSYVSIQLLKGRPVVEVPEAWNELMIQTKETLGIGRNIRFALSQFVPTPMLMGYFKPVILFPFASVNQLDLEQVEAILIHELSHILRQDYVWNWVIAMIQAVLFFNPFVWILVQLLEEERECACDDQVVRIQGRPLNYAQTLLQLSQLSQSQMAPVGVLQAGGNHKSQLFNRILRITDMNQMYKKITFMQQRFLLLAFALVVGLLMSGFKQITQFNLPAQQVKVQQEQTENGRELESHSLSHSILSEIVNETKEDPSISQQESVQNDSIIIQNVGVIAKLIDTVVMRSLTKSQNMNLDSLQKKTYLEVYASMFDHYKNYDSMLFKIAQNQYEMAKELHSKKGDHLELLKDTLVFKGFAEDFQKIIKMNNDFEETMKFFDRESPEFQNWFNLIASRHQQHNQRIKLLQDALLDSVQHNKVYPEDFLKNLKKQTLGLSSQGEEQLLLMKQLLSKNMMQLQKQRAITDQEKLMHDKINAQMKKLLQLEQ